MQANKDATGRIPNIGDTVVKSEYNYIMVGIVTGITKTGNCRMVKLNNNLQEIPQKKWDRGTRRYEPTGKPETTTTVDNNYIIVNLKDR